ncbi:transposase [Dankookia rubra]|uniref:transposase n=1 Tax=Dankookia rubra TaxID=1442381 RepID=UPI0019D574CC|nr:transposase [Dankookia rubra]
MPRLPARFAAVILCFALFFQQRSWRHAEVLLIGAILAPGRRTVTSILQISGLCRERRFVNYHRVLNRAAWSGRAAARVLLGLLLDAFLPAGPVLLGLDDTIERRRGKRISAKGIYRDPVRSSHGHFTQGQRPALAQPHAAGADLLGRAGLGTAVPDGSRPFGALLPRARAAPQEADRLGTGTSCW